MANPLLFDSLFDAVTADNDAAFYKAVANTEAFRISRGLPVSTFVNYEMEQTAPPNTDFINSELDLVRKGILALGAEIPELPELKMTNGNETTSIYCLGCLTMGEVPIVFIERTVSLPLRVLKGKKKHYPFSDAISAVNLSTPKEQLIKIGVKSGTVGKIEAIHTAAVAQGILDA